MKWPAHVGILAFILLASSLPGSALAQSSQEANVDYPGADHRSFSTERPDPALCRTACNADAVCRAYTFVRPARPGDPGTCFLKSTIPARAAGATCCVSGTKRIFSPTSRRTTFDPVRHGFQFANTFANNFISEIDWRTDGLCGGMVYSALDYFNIRSVRMPDQDWEPAEGMALRQYLYDRQVHSIERNIDKWAELMFNPSGTRNSEFYKWGLEGKPGGRIDELRRDIDAGRPVPLGLMSCDEGCTGTHQVLAIGYDMGRYRGDLGEHVRDFKIFVYDPNYPGRIMTLTPFPEASRFHYDENHAAQWRTYFVDKKYSPSTPPRVTRPANALILEMHTGGDDLRGGNDNLHVNVLLRNGRSLTFQNVNLLKRWINNSTNMVQLSLPPTLNVQQIRGVQLTTTFGGGIGGDNWNLDGLKVLHRTRSGGPTLFQRTGQPLFRFTGDQPSHEFLFDGS